MRIPGGTEMRGERKSGVAGRGRRPGHTGRGASCEAQCILSLSTARNTGGPRNHGAEPGAFPSAICPLPHHVCLHDALWCETGHVPQLMCPVVHHTRNVVSKASFWQAETVPSARRTRFAVPRARLWTAETMPWARKTEFVVSEAAYAQPICRIRHAVHGTLCQKRRIRSRNAAFDTQNGKRTPPSSFTPT